MFYLEKFKQKTIFVEPNLLKGILEIRKIFNSANVFANAIGIEATVLRDGYAEAVLTIRPEHSNTMGNLHGGLLFTLADCTTGFASKTTGKRTVTLEAKINYLRPVSVNNKYLKAIAQSKHVGRTIGVYSCDIFNESEEVVSTALFTFHFSDPK